MSELQQRLKEETYEKHKQAENHPLMAGFTKGEYKVKHLLQFLINIKPVYGVVEDRLLYTSIFKNDNLRRTPLIIKDIKLLSTKIDENEYHLLKPLKITDEWVARAWTKPEAFLKADLYVRWLADFYGGKMLSLKLAPFNQMYFSTDPAGVIRDVRSRLEIADDGITDDEFINEVNTFFDYHINLFDLIYNGIS